MPNKREMDYPHEICHLMILIFIFSSINTDKSKIKRLTYGF